MKPGTLTRVIGALLGATLAVSIASWGAQDGQALSSERTQTLQQESVPHRKLSDEERGDIFMARKSYTNAIKYYSFAMESYPPSPQNKRKLAALWNKTGICYQQEQAYKMARKAYKKSIHLDKTYARPWNNLGTTYYLNRKVKKSIKYYRHAVKLSPLSASFHLNLGTAYFTRKKYKKAFAEYHTAIKIDPGVLEQNSRQGTAVETRQASAKFYFYMAKVFASLGNASEAVRYLERAMEDGFDNRDRILKDPDMKKISKDPAFIALMKNPPVAIKN
ncbi:MAG: tetratricopeptide repeat protein [Acidobacteriota bacterium]